jgi:hypothetical protein
MVLGVQIQRETGGREIKSILATPRSDTCHLRSFPKNSTAIRRS